MTVPSFYNLLEESGYPPKGHPLWRYNGKLKGRQLAVSVGVRVPALLSGPGALDALMPPPAGAFVVKPAGGSNSRGVLPLVAQAGGGLRNAWTGAVSPWAAWVEQLREIESTNRRVRPPWLMEEMVGGGAHPPYDWKCYVIGGRVQMVRQMRRDGATHITKSWSPGWEPLGRIAPQGLVDDSMPPPRHGAGIVAAVERMAAALPGPFVRLDFYEDEDGPVFGEVTPRPGSRLRFVPEWDRRMAEAWMLVLERAKPSADPSALV